MVEEGLKVRGGYSPDARLGGEVLKDALVGHYLLIADLGGELGKEEKGYYF